MDDGVDWTDALLSDTREAVIALLDIPVDETEELVRQVVAQRDRIHRDARPLTDLDLADQLADATVALLRRAEPGEPSRLAAVAARYYAQDQGDDDLASPYGFDDDLEVYNAVAERVAPELVLDDAW